ncbi:MAG: helicase, partial [Fimbriimonadaceae bacterium]
MSLLDPNQYDIREEFQQLVLKDLLGPAAGPEEEINETWVSSRYLVGWLAPRDVGRGTSAAEARSTIAETGTEPLPDDNPLNPVSDDTPLGAGGDDAAEEGIDDDPLTGTESMLPNSLGITFCLSPEVNDIHIKASWGWYRRRKSETGYLTKQGDPKTVWYRTPIIGEANINLARSSIDPWVPFEDIPEVTVRTQIRRDAEGGKMVTLFLVNDQDGKDGKDDKWLFQVELSAETVDGSAGFVRRGLDLDESAFDELERIENQQTRMNYRHHVEFAVGHGISVGWPTPANPIRVHKVWTTSVPSYEVPRARPNDDIRGLNLSMAALASCSKEKLRGALEPMVDAYDAWINLEALKPSDPNNHLAEYGEALEWTEARARMAAKRIRAGIDLVCSDDHAFQAFAFMNRAMHDQRLHSLFSQKIRKGDNTTLEEVRASENISWYPFQLAFVLLNLPSLVDLEHPERAENGEPGPTAELLWFPTGGGKTESYLGLTAFTLAIRRLQGEIEGKNGQEGVAVLMRYTLRLLTLQQFQRATALICACEMIRREDAEKWGETPFRIGLWVGQSSTPNNYDQAEAALDETRRGDERRGAKGSLQQITNCPWCGCQIEVGKHLWPDAEKRRLITYCGDPLGRCPFSRKKAEWEGLPICIVDEEIYRLLPSLVIATVDKFAQMPWNGETAMLFGKVTKKCSRHGF